MLHPSYSDLMAVVNSEVEPGEEPLVQSRYSIVLATAKRARQIIGGQEPLVRTKGNGIKPLSIAVEELHDSKIKVLTEEEAVELARLRAIQLEEARKAKAAAKKKAEEEELKAADAENVNDIIIEEENESEPELNDEEATGETEEE